MASAPRLPRRIPAPAPPSPSPSVPAPLPVTISCEHCVRAVIGRFVRDDGRPAPRVPADLLVHCEAGLWRSIVSHATLACHPGRYQKIAKACPHFSPK